MSAELRQKAKVGPYVGDVTAAEMFEIKGGPGSGNWGHGGRPGHRGGSASRAKSAAGRPATEQDAQTIKITRKELALAEGAGGRIADIIGVDTSYAYHLGSTWAASATASYGNLMIHKAVADEFGLEMPEWQSKKLKEYERVRAKIQAEGGELTIDQKSPLEVAHSAIGYGRGAHVGDFATESQAIRAFTREMYRQTQVRLKAAGITEVTVFRGIRTRGGLGDITQGTDLKLSGNGPLASWSAKRFTAKRFASRGNKTTVKGSTKGGFMVGMKVPASRVMSVCFSGFGEWREYEAVLLQGSEDVGHVINAYKK